MRWIAIVLLVALVVGVGLIPGEKIYDDGLWDLSVTVRSVSGQPIKGMSAQAFVDIAGAQGAVADPPPLAATRNASSLVASYCAVQEPKADEPLKVKIPTSETSRCALLWTYRRFFQYRGLLIVAEYEGGKREA